MINKDVVLSVSKRCLSVLGASLFVLGLVLAAPVQAVTVHTKFDVTSTDDAADSNVGDGKCETLVGAAMVCTLRAAIQEANVILSLPPSKTINIIDVSLIVGTYKLSLPNPSGSEEDNAASGDLDIKGACLSADLSQTCLNITGNGAGQTIIDANGLDRAFHIVGANTVKISGVTIKNGMVTDNHGGGIKNARGWVTLENCEVSNNTVQSSSAIRYSGGGIYSDIGTRMAIKGCVISGNKVNNAEGIQEEDYMFGVGGGGGGIGNFGVMTIDKSTIQANSGRPFGGGILNASRSPTQSGELTFTNSVLQDNKNIRDNGKPNGAGGGLNNQGGRATITRSITLNNTALEGAGVFNTGSSNGRSSISGVLRIMSSVIHGNIGNGISNKDVMEVFYSTIDGNAANKAESFDINAPGAFDGGGINNYALGNLTIENSTITGNTARNGGGISNGRSMTLTSATISGNNASDGHEIFFNIQGLQNNPDKYSTAFLNSIVGGNTSNTCSGGTVDANNNTVVDPAYRTTITSRGHNLESGDGCALHAEGDQSKVDPNLDALVDNSAISTETALPTPVAGYAFKHPPTLLPQSGSPAINKGTCVSPFDQRLFGRPDTDGLCDIGAIEINGSATAPKADLEVEMSANLSKIGVEAELTYTITVTNRGPGTATGIKLIDKLPAGVVYLRVAQPDPKTSPPGNPDGLDCSLPGSGNPSELTCTIPTLGPSESFTVFLPVKIIDPSLLPTDSQGVQTIENRVKVELASPGDYLPGNNGSTDACVQGACVVTTVTNDKVVNFPSGGGGGAFGPWALLLLGAPLLFLSRRLNRSHGASRP